MAAKIIALFRGGVPGWLHLETGVWLPQIAGADDGGGEGDGADGAGDGADGSGDGDDGKDGKDGKAGKGGGSGDGEGDPDWKAESRKHENRSKAKDRKIAELEQQLEDKSGADKSEQEKAIEKARKEGRTAALSDVEKDRRGERLAVEVSKRARDLADVDTVILNLEKQIASDDISVFDSDGKVEKKALDKAIDDLLESKKFLKADPNSGRPSGGANGGEGAGGGEGGDMNDLIRQRAAGRT